ncbi:MAG TPA: hypothetical protein VFQ65_16510 [Kofleriaceae bacterium]|nr:hypothetical protein [Kofleriaceae bacterium]
MRHALFTTTTWALILWTTGCTGDNAASAPDAQVPLDTPSAGSAFACAGQALPTTAPDPLTVSGQTVDMNTLAPLSGVTISAFRTGNATALATATSDTAGDFTITVASGGMPIDGYLQAHVTGHLDTYYYGAVPVAADASGAQIALITQANLDTGTAALGITQSADNGAMLVRATDCNGVPLAGATFSTAPAGELRYSANSVPSTTATMTDASGVAFIYNVPPGTVTIDAMVGSRALRTRVVAVHADAGTVAGVRP